MKSSLKRHKEVVVHEGRKPFRCTFCENSFVHKSTLKAHILSVHEENKLFKCIICEKPFAHKASLRKHINTIHKRNEAFC